MRKSRTQQEKAQTHDVPLRGRRSNRSAANSLQFFARIEGVTDYDGRVRGANGIRWKVA